MKPAFGLMGAGMNCTRCQLDRAWTVDGKGLCLGCHVVIKQNRILELERESILLYVERDALRARVTELENLCAKLMP